MPPFFGPPQHPLHPPHPPHPDSPYVLRLEYRVTCYGRRRDGTYSAIQGGDPQGYYRHAYMPLHLLDAPLYNFTVENPYAFRMFSPQACNKDFPFPPARTGAMNPFPPKQSTSEEQSSNEKSSNEKSSNEEPEPPEPSVPRPDCKGLSAEEAAERAADDRVLQSSKSSSESKTRIVLKRLTQISRKHTYANMEIKQEFDYDAITKELTACSFKHKEDARRYCKEVAARHGFVANCSNGQNLMTCNRFRKRVFKLSGIQGKVGNTLIGTDCQFRFTIAKPQGRYTVMVVKNKHNHKPSISPYSNARHRSLILEQLRKDLAWFDVCDVLFDAQILPRKILDVLRRLDDRAYGITYSDIFDLFRRRETQKFGDLDSMQATIAMLESSSNFHVSYRMEGDDVVLPEVEDEDGAEDTEDEEEGDYERDEGGIDVVDGDIDLDIDSDDDSGGESDDEDTVGDTLASSIQTRESRKRAREEAEAKGTTTTAGESPGESSNDVDVVEDEPQEPVVEEPPKRRGGRPKKTRRGRPPKYPRPEPSRDEATNVTAAAPEVDTDGRPKKKRGRPTRAEAALRAAQRRAEEAERRAEEGEEEEEEEEEEEVVVTSEATTKSAVIKDLFFSHQKSFNFMRTFPEVISVDYSSHTNEYNYKLLNIVGVASCGRSFPIAHAFVSHLDADTFAWVFSELKALMDKLEVPPTKMVLSDCCQALVKAHESVFLGEMRLGEWHVNQAVIRRANKLFANDQTFLTFLESWQEMKNCLTVAKFMARYKQFKKDFWQPGTDRPDKKDNTLAGRKNRAFFYIARNWFGDVNDKGAVKHRGVLVRAYPDTEPDYFNKASARVDNILALQTSNSQSRVLSMYTSVSIVVQTSLGVLSDMEHYHAICMERYVQSLIRPFNQNVTAGVSREALKEVAKHIGRRSDSIACQEKYTETTGLPCPQTVESLLRDSEDASENGRQLVLGDFDPHWRFVHTTAQMTDEDWESATLYGQFKDKWRALRARESRYVELDKQLEEEREEKRRTFTEKHMDRERITGNIVDVDSLVSVRRKRGRQRGPQEERRKCPVCKKKDEVHAISLTCFRHNYTKYRAWQERCNPQKRYSRLVLARRGTFDFDAPNYSHLSIDEWDEVGSPFWAYQL